MESNENDASSFSKRKTMQTNFDSEKANGGGGGDCIKTYGCRSENPSLSVLDVKHLHEVRLDLSILAQIHVIRQMSSRMVGLV